MHDTDMSKSEMLNRSRKALAEFSQLPPEVQFRQLMAWGVIDAKGEVLFGRDKNGQQVQEGSQATTVHAHG